MNIVDQLHQSPIKSYVESYYNKIDDEKRSKFKEALAYIQRGAIIPEDLKSAFDINGFESVAKSSSRAVGDSFAFSSINFEQDSIDRYESFAKMAKTKLLKANSVDSNIALIQKQTGKNLNEIEELINKELINSNNIDIDTTDDLDIFNPLSSDNGKSIEIYDEILKQKVYISLTDDNKERLQKKFGSLENAKDYVKSWYKEAAYGVGYLKADKNEDGFIDKDEAKDLKAMIVTDLKSTTLYRSLNDIFQNPADSDAFLDEFGYISNINDFINNSIASDGNLNGALSFKELTKGNLIESSIAVLNSKEMSIFEINRIFNTSQSITAIYSNEELKDDLLSSFLNTNEDVVYESNKEEAKKMALKHGL